MTEAFTVQAVEQAASGGEGEKVWTRQKLLIKDATGAEQTVTLFCNKWQPVPTVGSTIEGTVKPPKQQGWTPELEVPRKSGQGGHAKPPEERRSIAMQHAQKCAVTILSVAAEHGEYKPPNAGDVVGQVKTIAQALFEQVQQAEASA